MGNRPSSKSCFSNLVMDGHFWQEKYFIGPWPTAFPRVGAEPWVIHRPGPLRPGSQRTWAESSSWKAEGTAPFSRSARAKKRQIDEQNRTAGAGSGWRSPGRTYAPTAARFHGA